MRQKQVVRHLHRQLGVFEAGGELANGVPEVVLTLWPNGDPAASTALRLTAGASLFGTAVGSVNYLLIMSGRASTALRIDSKLNGISGISTMWAPPAMPPQSAIHPA